jgi:hypothetical protein
MPLYCDTAHYDICARSLLQGGVLYRDTFDTNLPGMVWSHMAVRALLGWSPEVIRVADLLVLIGVIVLLLRMLQRAGVPGVGRLWTAVALYGFYLAAGEDCHCQRDLWMLLPAAVALGFRSRQAARINGEGGPESRLVAAAALEGLCWGLACWIKPHVLVVAAFCWGLSPASSPPTARIKLRLADAAGLLAGGLIAGGLGCAWLWRTGAWHYFWQTMLSWGLEYSSWPAPKWALRALVVHRFTPWVLAHLVALPLAVSWVYRSVRTEFFLPSPPLRGRGVGGDGGKRDWVRSPSTGLGMSRERGLLGCFYLAWLLQADLLQHGTPYHHVPALLLALAVAACWYSGRPLSGARGATLLLFAAVAVAFHPMFQWQRLSAWGRCFGSEGDAELKNRLALTGTTD